MTMREGGSNIDFVNPVLDGTAQFGIISADDLIVAHTQGKPLCAIAMVYRRSPVVFIALADSGITRPQDFIGKTLRISTSTTQSFRAMMARVGIRPDQYTVVNVDNDLALLASGQIPVWSAFVNAFAVTAQHAGYKLNFIYPDDYGVHFYSDSIFATDDLIAKNPDLVRRFLRATLKGWTFAIENPTAVGQMVVKYKPDADVALENAKMTAALPFVNTGEDYIGWMKPGIWAEMEKTLREQGVFTKPVDVTQVYTMQFLQEIYGK